MQEQLSYEKRLEIASHLCDVLRSLYPDKVITLSDTRALRLAQDRWSVESSRGED
jgi:hypothetical protein